MYVEDHVKHHGQDFSASKGKRNEEAKQPSLASPHSSQKCPGEIPADSEISSEVAKLKLKLSTKDIPNND
ncbi:unnamed protein product [Ilex paraguariensis]|uniref:Uncharacterized protein n=1 Tax=Ilex paraguariensis TaxID=185542 RepID=A0ABC8U2S9_9AQUA